MADLTEPVLGEASQRLRRASIDSSNPKVRRATEQAVEVWRKLGDQTNVVKHRAAEVKHKAAEQLEKTREAAKAPRRMMTNFEFYLLWALIFLVVGYFAVFSILKLLTKVRVIWFLTRAEYLDDFRRWTSEVCAEPWQHETVLCQAADGNWIARELIRAKIAAKDEDNCDPGTNDGCRYEACSERGLSSVLHKLASSLFSPLNAPGPVHGAASHPQAAQGAVGRFVPGEAQAVRGVHCRARNSPRAIRGAILGAQFCALRRDALTADILAPSAQINERVNNFPGIKTVDKLKMKEWLLNKFVFPIVRDWGVVIGGAPLKGRKGCAKEPWMITKGIHSVARSAFGSFLSAGVKTVMGTSSLEEVLALMDDEIDYEENMQEKSRRRPARGRRRGGGGGRPRGRDRAERGDRARRLRLLRLAARLDADRPRDLRPADLEEVARRAGRAGGHQDRAPPQLARREEGKEVARREGRRRREAGASEGKAEVGLQGGLHADTEDAELWLGPLLAARRTRRQGTSAAA